MSATSEVTKNLNKEGEPPAAALSEDIPTITPTDISSSIPKDVVETSQGDYLEDPTEVESIIEKKLPSDKEKTNDVDSELDFELKWDDDTDLNENQKMSATSEDTKNLNKEGETSATALSEDIPTITPTDVSTSVPKDVVEDPRGNMSIVGKKPPSDKQKATDVDSELDCALKWHDNTDFNENQDDNDDIDLDSVVKELESELASEEKDLDTTKKETESLDKEIDSAFASTEKDTLHKTDSNVTSIERDLDSVDKADSAFTSTEKDLDLDHEIETNLMSIEKGDSLDTEKVSASPLRDKASDDIESNAISIEKDLDSVHKIKDSVTPGDNLDKEMEDAVPENILGVDKDLKDAITSLKKDNAVDEIAMGVDYVCEDIQSTAAAKESEILATLDALKTGKVFENKAINVDAKINMGIETSPVESETNSLDEELVYSDADVPDMEDKDLMDEIDAEMIAEMNENKSENAETLQISSEILTFQKQSEGKTTAKEASVMDVEVNSIKSSNLAKDLNETCSSVTDLETSTYDINNEHELDRPDVMIEIPTQELIESFDDFEDIAEDANNKLGQSQIKIMDKPDIETISKPNILLTVDKENPVETNKSAGDTVQAESMEVDTDDISKEIEKSDIIVNSELNSNVATNTVDQENVSTSKEKVNHADVILEAISTPELTSKLANRGKNVESENLKLKELERTLATTVLDETRPLKSDKDVESTDNSKLKDTETHDTLKESSDSSKLKEVEDEAQPSKEVQESDSLKLKEVEHELSTSNHSELSDEDQEATDSLSLLAESSRVLDDDDEPELEAEPDDDDDDDDDDQDDESNQMTAEHSEDSNAQHSEADVPREAMEVDESTDAQESSDMPDPHDLDDAGDERDDEKSNDEKEESNDEKVESNDDKDESNDEKVESNDEKDESNDSNDEVDLQIQIADVISQTVEAVAMPGESVEGAEDIEKAVEAVLEDKKEDIADVSPVAAAVEDRDAVKQTDSDSDSSASSKLRELLLKDRLKLEAENKSPSKIKKLEISTPKNDINIVELEESSSEDVLADVQLVNKSEPASSEEVMSSLAPAEGEATPAAADKPSPQKTVRLNTDEVSIKTPPAASVAIPETKVPKTTDPKASIDFGLEIYSLDSDDEETEVRSKRKSKLTALELDNARQANKCINVNCTSDGSVPLVPASMAATVYYAATQQRGGGLCLNCAKRFEERSEKLIQGVKDLTPFLSMDMCLIREEFVEISDSDSEEEPEVGKDDQIIGEEGAKFLEEHLADVFNVAWEKFDVEARLLAAQAEINVEVGQLEDECKEIDAMLNECQKETDKLRNDLYTRFADDRRELPAITICDTPTNQWSGLEEGVQTLPSTPEVREQRARYGKRRAAPAQEPAAKRPAIPLGYAPLDGEHKPAEPKPGPSAEMAVPIDDDNADISVVKLSVEAAPAGLPPPGVPTRAPLRPNMLVYAMRNTFGAWHKVRIVEVQPKLSGQFTTCRVKFEQPKTMTKMLPARCLAYEHAPDVRLVIGTRVVALFKDHRVSADKKEEGEKKEAYYSGIVAETPNPVNSFRYLIFFDDGYAQYVQHSVTRLVCECAQRVWDEVHPFSRQFVRDYLRAYPERPMVRLHAGQSIKTEWDGKWWASKVLKVDASLVLVYFEGKKDNKTEWIYRGSTRLAPLYLELQAAERTRARPLPRAQATRRFNMPYVEYTRSDDTPDKIPSAPGPSPTQQQTQAQIEQEIRRQRAVAKKSTAFAAAAVTATATAPASAPAPAPLVPRDNVTSRVVFYTPKNAIKPHKMVSHTCGPRCKRTDVLALKDLRTYNPLTKPLLSGWERQQVKYRIPAVKAVMYRAPCGRRIRDYKELHTYLQAIDSDMGVDLFDFNPATHCLAEFLLNKCLISKKDLSHGKENVPVPCVNYYDSSLPEFCSYNTERTPTAGVPLNLDPEFLCGCDCTDDCADKSKCACWKMTLEGARTIGLDTSEVGYVYKRLPEPLPSGIYECNVRCKCKQTCMNRVAQHPLQLKLQVFKTANRGWGIRALNDVPKGAFLCVYAGNLLTDATANLDGLNEGDEYLAELDYIEVVEQMKEGFEEDIPEDAKKLDEEESSMSSMSSSDSEQTQDADDDFRPAAPAARYTRSEYSKRLRKREKTKKAKEKEDREKKEREDKQREKDGEDCITISDDEELREPAHFSVQTGMKGNKFISKYKSVRTLFGKDEACYIMDAKVQGNIGRYLNHSCTPNVFVQNVFVDSHDPRFPWVAFFALSQIRAGTELTWNYNYDVGSVPGKVLYCYCNAPNCRGRLL